MTTLTVTAEPKNWQNAIKVAVQEVGSAIYFSAAVALAFLLIICLLSSVLPLYSS